MVDSIGRQALSGCDRALITIRPALMSDTEQIAQVWHDAWHDAHGEHLPDALVRVRTPANFRERTPALISHSFVATDHRGVIGFCTVREDELDLLFVSAPARGTGCASELLEAGEMGLARRGVGRAWLSCVVGNHRAARFYTRHGWELVGTMTDESDVGGATIPFQIWRYEKSLGAEP